MVEHGGGNVRGSVGSDDAIEDGAGVPDSVSDGWNSLEELAHSGGVNSGGWDSVAAMAGQMGEDASGERRDIERQKLLDAISVNDGDGLSEEQRDLILRGGWNRDDGFIEKYFEMWGGVDGLFDIGVPIEKILGNQNYYGALTQERLTSLPAGVLGEIYEKMCVGEDGTVIAKSVERFRRDFLGNEQEVRWTVERRIQDMLVESGFRDFFPSDFFSEPANIDGSEKDLVALKAVSVNVLDTPCVRYLGNDNDVAVGKFGARMVELGLLGEDEVSSIYHFAIDIPSSSGNRSLVSVALEHGLKPREDDMDGMFWHKCSEGLGGNALDAFYEDCYKSADSIDGYFDFRNPSVQRVFIERCLVGTSIQMLDLDSFKSLIEDNNFQDMVMDRIARETDLERAWSVPVPMLMLMADKDVLDSMVKRGVFKKYPQFGELPGFSPFISGEYTERDRIRLFLDKDSDEYYDEMGNPNDTFYEFYGRKDNFYDKCLTMDESRRLAIWRGYMKICDDWSIYSGGRGYCDYLDTKLIDKYFDASGPKQEFWRACFDAGDYSFLAGQDEETRAKMGFEGAVQHFINYYNDSSFVRQMSLDRLHDYFDESGPKQEFWRACFDAGDYSFLAGRDEETKKSMGLSETELSFMKISDKVARDIVIKKLGERFGDDDAFAQVTPEQMDDVVGLWSRVRLSNSEEISAHVGAFLLPLVDWVFDDGMESAMKKFEHIEGAFTENNLPYVGKVFKTFRCLYPIGQHHRASNALERGALNGLPEFGIKSKDTILFSDLLKSSMGSNNRDLKNYLANLQIGERLAGRLMSGENDFSDDERESLAKYAAHLAMLYNETEQGKRFPVELSGNGVGDVKRISSLFSSTERHGVPDRVVRSFGFSLGIKSCQEMIDRMASTVREADARNRRAAEVGEFTLESGDLIKSTGIEYLGGILQNGSVSKEFLNGETESDSTPLDTDLNILPEGLSGSIAEGVDKKNAIAAFGAMHCMMVIKGDGRSGRKRFQMEGEGGYNPDLYEIWHNGGDNYGIRVGFPSTEIDYLIYDDLGKLDSFGDLARIKFEVVRNGFYIPIVDKKTGELVFDPDEYDSIRRRRMGGLTQYGVGENYIFADEGGDEQNDRPVDDLAVGQYTIILPDGKEEVIPSIMDIAAGFSGERERVDGKRAAIIEQVIKPVLKKFNIDYKDHLDGSLVAGSAEVIDTGSTGRHSNMPGDGDFDFMMKLDRSIVIDDDKMNELRESFCDALGLEGNERLKAIVNGNFRAKGVFLDGLEAPVDIDITFRQKTNKVGYSTDVALREYYEAMERASYEKAIMAKANVVFAKKFLKAIGAYKGRNSRKDDNRVFGEDGGLGGVGVENWIAQNGGSFVAAAIDFMMVAERSPDFDAFKSQYAIFDFGENHYDGGHDNFVVKNLGSNGYRKMKDALGKFLHDIGVRH